MKIGEVRNGRMAGRRENQSAAAGKWRICGGGTVTTDLGWSSVSAGIRRVVVGGGLNAACRTEDALTGIYEAGWSGNVHKLGWACSEVCCLGSAGLDRIRGWVGANGGGGRWRGWGRLPDNLSLWLFFDRYRYWKSEDSSASALFLIHLLVCFLLNAECLYSFSGLMLTTTRGMCAWQRVLLTFSFFFF